MNCPGGTGSDTQSFSPGRKSSLVEAAQDCTSLYYHHPAKLRTQGRIIHQTFNCSFMSNIVWLIQINAF